MFRKSPEANQLDLFSTPQTLLSAREAKAYTDEKGWHNQFFRNVTCNIDEDIFKVLFSESREKGKDGHPNAPIRILIAMSMLKEGAGCSDEQLYENCRFNLLWRLALGLSNLDDELPSMGSYYNLRKGIVRYEEEHGVNLMERCFKGMIRRQAIAYKVSGKSVRTDCKLISSNIAWYSRYEIIHSTLIKGTNRTEIMHISNQTVREAGLELLGEDAAKTVYTTATEAMGRRLVMLGLVIDAILALYPKGKDLLKRVFDEQYEKDENGVVTLRDRKKVKADSLQNPNDPDAGYRCKNGKKVKGYVTNITETTDQQDAPSLITDVQVDKVNTADNTFVKDAVKCTEEVTGNDVGKFHADGSYQSEDNRRLASGRSEDLDHGFGFVANGIQGRQARYRLDMNEDGTITVTDANTGEVIPATLTRNGDKWKISITDKDGAVSWRYFDSNSVERSKAKQEVEAIPAEERRKRNNVEASVFQYCFHTRDNKTRYRDRIKHLMQAVARCAWINMRRLMLFDLRNSVQMCELWG